MTFKEVMKTLDISAFKVVLFSIFSKTALIDYLCEKANNAINALLDANQEQVEAVRTALARVLYYFDEYHDYVPIPWVRYFDAFHTCLKAVLAATEDCKVDTDEARNVIEAAMVCYSQFRAE